MDTRHAYLWCRAPILAAIAMTPVLFAGEGPPIAPPPARVPTYRFTAISTLPGFEQAIVHDINNAGQVVGTAWRIGYVPNPILVRQAFIFQDGVLSDIGTSAVDSGAEGINDLGHIVGLDENAQSSQVAILLDEGGRHELHCCTAVDVNNRDQVIINTGVSYLWDNGTLTHLGGLGASPQVTEAAAINSHGQIVGRSNAAVPTWPYSQSRAFLWQGGEMYELPRLDGGAAAAVAINDVSDVVGYSGGRPVLWRSGAITDLSEAPYYLVGGVSALNNHGWIVSWMEADDSGEACASLWRNGSTYDLNRLVPPDVTWHLTHATAVNDEGSIAGVGRSHAHPDRDLAFVLFQTDADVNGDGRVSALDFHALAQCLAGPSSLLLPACLALDLDWDADVDLVDYRALELAFQP